VLIVNKLFYLLYLCFSHLKSRDKSNRSTSRLNSLKLAKNFQVTEWRLLQINILKVLKIYL